MITGSIVALVTPMHEDGSLDKSAFEKLLDWHLSSGTDAIVVAGTTGESATLSHQEHHQVIEWAVGHVAGQVPVIAGTGSNSTAEALELTEAAKALGADAALIVTPYYNKPTQQGLIAHYSLLANKVDLPQILYNVPGRTACDMLPETIAELAKLDTIVGCKEATGDVSRVADLLAMCGPEFALYSGDDLTGCEFMLAGGHGVISVTNNIIPAQMKKVCDAALSGQAEHARALDSECVPLHKHLFVEPNPVPVKWALYKMGLIQSGIRLPLLPLSAQHHSIVESSLLNHG